MRINQSKEQKLEKLQAKQNPLIPEILEWANNLKMKITDDIQTVIIQMDETPFRIMVSRLSNFFQLYQRGGGHNFITEPLSQFDNIDSFAKYVKDKKVLFESGHIFKEVIPAKEEEDIEEYLVTNVKTGEERIFTSIESIMEYLNCDRQSVTNVILGKRVQTTRGHTIVKVSVMDEEDE